MARVLVLTAASELSDAAVQMAVRAAGAGSVRRLASEAVEALLPDAEPGRLAAARAALLDLRIDANVVNATGREKRALLADMDSTIIGVECIDEIADFAGVKQEVAAVTEAAMRGELDFEGALTARVALLKGMDAALLHAVHADRVRLNPGARTLVRTMAARGAATALVSGGFTFFTQRVAAEAGFAEHHANTLGIDDGVLAGTVGLPILGRQAKAERLAAVCAERGLSAEDVIAVGDGANDLAMITAAGLGVAYRAKPALAEAANARVDHADLTALLHLQRVPKDNWVI